MTGRLQSKTVNQTNINMKVVILLSFLLALILTGVSLQVQEDVVSIRGSGVRVRKMMRVRKMLKIRKMLRGLKKMRKLGKPSSRAVFKGEDCDFIK